MTDESSRRSVRTEQLAPDEPVARLRCRQCGMVRVDDERFCESCGYDHTTPATWSLEISVDRAHYERMASGLTFPAGRMPAVVVFDADEITIGRRNEQRGIEPDVDLSGPLADPGASHRQIEIRRDPASGHFAVVDLGSTNGTMINDDDQPIEPHQAVELAPGDEIHVGAWTTIRLTVYPGDLAIASDLANA